MATGKSGTIVTTNTASSGLAMGSCRFTWTETYDIATNTSVVSITKMEMLCAGDGYGNQNYGLGVLWFNGSVSINGTTVASVGRSNAFYVNPVYGAYTDAVISTPALPWTVSVPHNNDGSKSIQISIDLHALSSSGNAKTNTTISGTFTITLTTIPRVSKISAPDGTCGTTIAIAIDKSASAFTNTVSYTIGSASGTIATKSSASSVNWAIPIDLCNQIKTSTSGNCTLKVETFNGNTSIGTSTITIKLLVPSDVKPSIASGWASVSYLNTGTAAKSIADYVQGYSKATVTFDSSKVTKAYGADISSFYIVFGGTTYNPSNNVATTGTLSASGEQSITAYVKDARGRTNSQKFTFTVQEYAKPKLSKVSVFRCEENGSASETGTYFSAKATAVYSSINGKNQYTLTAKNGNTTTPLTSATAKIIGGLSATSSYAIQITVTDSLGFSATNTITIATASIAMNLRRDNNGVAFGKYAEAEKTLELPAGWNITIGASSVLHNEDILDNGWFLINQRGLTSYSGSAAYSLDRWRRSSARTIITVHDGYIIHESSSTATNYAYTYQLLELSRFDDADYLTISMLFDDGHLMTATGEYKGLDTNFSVGYYQNTAIALYQITEFPGYLAFRIATKYPSLSANIKAVKVERGKVSTLANDVPPNYAAELLKCQRYYVRFSRYTTSGFVTSSQKNYYMPVNLPVVMRTTPSVASTGWKGRTSSGYSAHSGTSYVEFENISVSYYNGNYVSVIDSIATGSDTNNTVVAFEINNLEFSADL